MPQRTKIYYKIKILTKMVQELIKDVRTKITQNQEYSYIPSLKIETN